MKAVMPIALTLIAASPAPLPPAAPLAPVGKWTVEYAESLCVLSHDFGTDQARVTVGIRPWPMGQQTEIVLIQPGASGPSVKIGKGHVRLDPAGTDLMADYTLYSLPKKNIRIATLNVEQSALSKLGDAKTMTIALEGKPPVTVAPSKFGNALAALKPCDDDLLTGWGVDLATREAIVADAVPIENVRDWISDADYPSGVDLSGTTTILWQISPDGRVTQCRTVASSGSIDLDAAACRAITLRGRYRPGLDKDGKPRTSFSTRRIVWLHP